MRMQISNDFEQKLAQIYSSKVTVNLDTESPLSPKEFWSTMEVIAVNHKAMINFRITK